MYEYLWEKKLSCVKQKSNSKKFKLNVFPFWILNKLVEIIMCEEIRVLGC